MFTERNIEARGGPPEELDRMIRDEMQQWGEVIRKADIRAE